MPFGAVNQGTMVKSPVSRSRAGAASTLSSYIDDLYLLIYDSKNNLAANIKQLASDTGFGRASVKLNPGTYRVIAAGGQQARYSYFAISPDSTGQFVYWDAALAAFGDAFFKNTTITVNSTGGNFNLALNRVVGQIEVNIQDAIPANAKTISFSFWDDDILTFNGAVEGQANQGASADTLTTGATNTKIYSYVLNTVTPVTVLIKCFDASGNIIAQRTVNNVTCEANAITLLTGDLFTGGSGGGIGVTYNPAWKVQTINYTF